MEASGISRIYSPDDGRTLGLQGMIDDLVEQADFPVVDPDADLDRVAERLIELTLERGARDNVTVVVVRRAFDPPSEDTETVSLPVPVARSPTLAMAASPLA